ncbi:MAG: hypothetical protein KAR20_20195 [Candidatus Heimdallarchaeota archaeon]|nr:hypothetical protein [Candidatus Heimdallarchaeota archaeon]
MAEIKSLQDYPPEWWVEDISKELAPGRLIWLYYPYMNVIPYEFIAEERVDSAGNSDSTNHDNLGFVIREFRMSERAYRPRLPVSSFPKADNEIYLISKAKKRPAIVIANDKTGFSILKDLKQGISWQKQPSLIVAPYYGVEANDGRKGFPPNFVERVRLCEYPELMYAKLPFHSQNTEESLLYLKHMAAVGRHHETVEPTKYCLSEDAMCFFEEQLKWYIFNEFESNGLIADFRKEVTE